MKKRMLYLILPILSIILESLPYGAVLTMWDGEQIYRKTFSYFDVTLIGFAKLDPMFIAILTSVGFLLLLVFSFGGKERWAITAKAVFYVGAIYSIGTLVDALIHDIRLFSVVGLFISLSLIAETLILHFTVDPCVAGR